MFKDFNSPLKGMARIEQVEQKNKQIKGGDNSKVFLYLGTFFIMAVSLSIGILVVMYFLIKLDYSF